jgi:capsule polysaccharide export protein KpsE/RkpR
MNTQRLFNVVLLEWSTEKLKIEDDLERVIASDDNIESKSSKIRGLVARLAAVETNIEKFNTMVSANNNGQEKKD